MGNSVTVIAMMPAAGKPNQAINGPVSTAIVTAMPPAQVSLTPMVRPRSAVSE
jgi:hypothetical protein